MDSGKVASLLRVAEILSREWIREIDIVVVSAGVFH